MFRRKKENEDEQGSLVPAAAAATGDAAKIYPRPVSSAPAAPATTTSRPSAPPAPGAPAPRPPGTGSTRPAGSPEGEGKKLIVGRDIMLSGQITSCDKLVVEGRVEATLNETRAIEIAQSGIFKGNCEIEAAEIAGRFDGSLTVRQRLFIRSTGKVTGTIRYGQIEIEAGGEISGEIQVSGAAKE